MVVAFVILLLLVNMAFSLGLVFEMSGRDMPDTPDIPYSPMIEELYGDYGVADRDCAEWLTYKSDKHIPILGDYNAQCLLLGYDYDRTRVDYGYQGKHYLFLTENNRKTGKMIYGRSPALRFYKPFPNLFEYTVVFKSGNAVVMIKE